MSILPNRRLLLAIILSSILFPLLSSAQVTIKEKVEIKPKAQSRVQIRLDDSPYFEGTIAPGNTHQGFSVLRSCEVIGIGQFDGPGTQMMIVAGTYGNLTNNTVRTKFYCAGAVQFELWTWTTCGIVVESITGSISGSTATYVIAGYQSFPHPMNVPFTASVTFGASPSADFDLTSFSFGLNSGTEIVCGGSLPISFTALDAGGRIFCDPSNTQVTASVSANGNYVYLTSRNESGPSITFPLSEGSFSLVLDPALGLIPNGLDVAHVSLQSEGGQGAVDITLRCVYEPPTVQIVFPPPDSPPFLVTERHQPIIPLGESHTPGGALEPRISWSPKSTIDSKDYFSQLQDSIPYLIPISVTATNVVGTDSDIGQLLLMKVKDVDHFSVTATPDTILFNDYSFISGLALDENGNEAWLDPETPITLTAEPNTIGRFYQDVVTYGQLKAGDVIYLGDVVEPDGIQDIIITVSGDGKSGTGKVVVKMPPCLVLHVTAPETRPGGTVPLVMMARTADGTLAPYPADQMFFVWMNTDESFGRLRSGWGEEGSFLFGPQPFEFIAADSIAMDSALVEIQAEASMGGVSIAARYGPGNELQKQQKLSVSKLMNILSGGNQSVNAIAQPAGKLAAGQTATASVQTHSSSALLKKLHPSRTMLAEGAGCVSTGTVIVKKGNEPTLDHFLVTAVPDSILHGQSSTLSILAVDADGIEVQIDGSTPMTFMASPPEHGVFEPSTGITYAVAKSGGVKYNANGANPSAEQGAATVAIVVSGQGKSGAGQVVVERVACVQVVVHPDTLAPGQTGTLEFVNPDGPAFSPSQMFNVVVIGNGSDLGQLVSGSGSGSALSKARTPITFVAPSVVSGPSLTLSVRASAIGGGSAAATSVDGIAALKKGPVQAVTQAISKRAQDSLVAAIRRLLDASSCPPATPVVVEKKNVTLTIVRPTVQPNATKEITKEPKMPILDVEATLENSDWKMDVYYYWKMALQWTDRWGRVWKKEFEEVKSSTAHSYAWTIPWENTFVGGDNITINVRAAAGTDDPSAVPVVNPYKIIGRNPDKADAIAGLNDLQRAVMYHESGYRQFDAPIGGVGFPLVGATSRDYGMMQINESNNPTLNQLWNWKENKDRGLFFLSDAQAQALKWPKQIRNNEINRRQELNIDISDPVYRNCPQAFDTEEQLWKETYARYNGGSLKTHFWVWLPADENNPEAESAWIKDNFGGSGGYAVTVWGIYTNKPNGW